MPQNNQVLEKREGYRQVFYAAAMVDLALQLNWEGEQKAYSGESKNTALLYEYWLFFELRKIIISIENCQYMHVAGNTADLTVCCLIATLYLVNLRLVR